MQHYSDTLSNGIFLTFCQVDETIQGIRPGEKDSISQVTASLYDSMEIEYNQASQYICTGKTDTLTPAQCRVLDEYLSFYHSVILALKGHEVDGGDGFKLRLVEPFNKAFSYINLNKGRSVVWYVSLFG